LLHEVWNSVSLDLVGIYCNRLGFKHLFSGKMSSVTVSEIGRTIIRTKLKSTKNKLRVMETFCSDASSQIQIDLNKLNTKRAELAQDLERLNNQKVTANTSAPTPSNVNGNATSGDSSSSAEAAVSNQTSVGVAPAPAPVAPVSALAPAPATHDNQAEVVRLLIEIRRIDQRLKIVNQKLKFINKTKKTLKRLKNERRDIRNQFNGIIHRDFETNHFF